MNRATLGLDLAITRDCPFDCVYCGVGKAAGRISRAHWSRALDLLLLEEGPLALQLMGGEPLLEYPLVLEILSEAARRAVVAQRRLSLGVTTNGLLLTPERSRELARLGASVMLSLDGDRSVQLAQRRPRAGDGEAAWSALRRNLAGLRESGAPFFVNLVATPEHGARVDEGVRFLLGEGARSFSISYALGLNWSRAALSRLTAAITRARAAAADARPRGEVHRRDGGVEPVLLSPQHLLDADGVLYLGTALVVEKTLPRLHAAMRVGPVDSLTRLPGRAADQEGQRRRAAAASLGARERRLFENNLEAGRRLARYWERIPRGLARGALSSAAVRPSSGEAVELRGLAARLSEMGVPAGDPLRGGRLGEAYLMLTMSCNLRCRACALWGVGGACHTGSFFEEKSRPLPLARALKLVDEVAALRPLSVNFSGGEPLMSPHWAELAGRAKERGLRTILTTNGVLLERHAARVAELFDQVSISVACPPALREELRMGPPGHYEAMTRGLRALASLRDGAPARRPRLRMLCEVFDSNAGRLGETVEHLSREGVTFDEILFQHLIFNRPEVLSAQEAVLREEFGLPMRLWRGYAYAPAPMDFEAFAGELRALRDRYPHAVFSVPLFDAESLRDYYEGGRGAAGPPYCDGPWTQLNIFPNGEVWACPDIVLGGVAERPLEQVWQGAAARGLRRRVCERLFPSCRGCFSFFNTQLPSGAAAAGGAR